MSEPYHILGPQGQTLYPSTRNNPRKYRRQQPLYREMKRSITQRDHAEMVADCTQLAARIPILGGACRQMGEWAFAGDSWQPIYYGENEAWGDLATDYLVHEVFPNCIRRTPHKSLIKAMQVSAKGWLVQGDDLALFGTDENNRPTMTVIPATAIGNGDPKQGWWNVVAVNFGGLDIDPSGYGVCNGGKFDGFRIYNGIIYDDNDEPIAARVLGWKRAEAGDSDNASVNGFQPTYADFQLGFKYGAHMAFPYEWHGMGRPIPRISSAATAWKDFEERDDAFQKGIKLAATKMVIHQLAPGQDAVEARGDAAQQIITTDCNGNEQVVYVESLEGGNVTYIGSGESLQGADFENPHPNVEEFAIRKLRECVFDLGWLFEMIDLTTSQRASSRIGCALVNNSIWQLQTIGEERMFWFTKFAVAHGLANGKIPQPPVGSLDDAYKWTFGYPGELSVDMGNDVTASLNRLRYGLTSQRIESAKWGHVQKRIDKDRAKEAKGLLDRIKEALDYSNSLQLGFNAREIRDIFWQPSPNATVMASEKVDGSAGNGKPAPNNGTAENAKGAKSGNLEN